MVIDQHKGFKKNRRESDGRQKMKQKWMAPETGLAKLNVDGAFSSTGGAGVGMALQDHQGTIIVAACRDVQNCRDAT
jgi:hypothetical protein